jgi:16S rRNA (adenine1518-N6/adenine1519-N6)-dimethyltransferase
LTDMGQKLGQHFLTRPEVAGWVADAVALTGSDTVLEIGPGHGILTRELLCRAGKVVALEKDTTLVPELQETFADDIEAGRLVLLEEDVRNFEPASCEELQGGYALVANIPYYITGAILRQFLTTAHQPQNMALLVQKEVAQRATAKEGKQSLLSLSVAAYGMPELVRVVKAGAFSPPPTVDSAVLAVRDISKGHFESEAHEERFFALLHSAFEQKRKMLSSTLGAAVPDERYEQCSVPKTARPEDVPLASWLCVSR